MTKSENIFVCIGAIHNDYLINLKKNIKNLNVETKTILLEQDVLEFFNLLTTEKYKE